MPVFTSQLDFIGDEVPLRFVIGQLIDIALAIVDEDGATVNVTGRTYTAEIGPDEGASVVSFVQVNTDPLTGLINLTLDTSSGITAGTYRWIAWEDGNNYLWGGPVEVIAPSVT